jgi:hypothetical protein
VAVDRADWKYELATAVRRLPHVRRLTRLNGEVCVRYGGLRDGRRPGADCASMRRINDPLLLDTGIGRRPRHLAGAGASSSPVLSAGGDTSKGKAASPPGRWHSPLRADFHCMMARSDADSLMSLHVSRVLKSTCIW